MTGKESILINELKNQNQLLKQSIEVLDYSFNKCLKIGIKEKYSTEEFESLDALTSRFARTSDILIQKIFLLIDDYFLEDKGTIIDRLNRAEKREIINSALQLRKVRELRNRIVHEYVIENLFLLFNEVLDLAPSLISDCSRTSKYVEEILYQASMEK